MVNTFCAISFHKYAIASNLKIFTPRFIKKNIILINLINTFGFLKFKSIWSTPQISGLIKFLIFLIIYVHVLQRF